jgi:hypothetical protein
MVYSYVRGGDALQGRLKTLSVLRSGKNIREYPWVKSFEIEHGRSYTDYSFWALLFGPEVVDDMQRAMVDFLDDYRPTDNF